MTKPAASSQAHGHGQVVIFRHRDPTKSCLRLERGD